MAVQLNYLAKRGWKPENAENDWLITLMKMVLLKQQTFYITEEK